MSLLLVRRNKMGRKIFTTRDVDVRFDDRQKKLKQVTTKEIEVKHLGQDEPLVPASGPLITTHNIEDFQKPKKKAEKKTPAKKKAPVKQTKGKQVTKKK